MNKSYKLKSWMRMKLKIKYSFINYSNKINNNQNNRNQIEKIKKLKDEEIKIIIF